MKKMAVVLILLAVMLVSGCAGNPPKDYCQACDQDLVDCDRNVCNPLAATGDMHAFANCMNKCLKAKGHFKNIK